MGCRLGLRMLSIPRVSGNGFVREIMSHEWRFHGIFSLNPLIRVSSWVSFMKTLHGGP